MNQKSLIIASVIAALCVVISARFAHSEMMEPKGSMDSALQTGHAEIFPLNDQVSLLGHVRLEEKADGLVIRAQMEGLSPGKYGFHIHENGSCADGGQAAGGHFNPEHVDHGDFAQNGPMKAHVGDLGNIEIGDNGIGMLQAFLPEVGLTGGKYQVNGKAFIVHEKEDDFGQPTGNAGGRIGCGLIVTE